MKLTMWIAALTILLLGGCTNQVQLGADAYNRGEYDKAARFWNPQAEAGNPHAEYNIGLLWEAGLGTTPQNTAEASNWYLRSAEKGYVPAMVRLANLQRNFGHDVAALSWLALAARWGNSDAISALAAWDKPIPPADLFLQAQSQAALADDAAASQVASDIGYMLGCALAGGSCAPNTNSTTSPGSAVESRIDGEFEGWEGETIVKLMNGQIWQQTDYYYHYHYSYMPEVLVYRSGSGYKMKVEGIDKAIGVERIR